ncbi:MAG: FecR domain-containing protein [Acidobacteria bacterium]|uniref:FecR domain-containing protein n=1 Tax=Candidatus Polarisedimenticola svalbardensis TaxID=2886004 RepID=A0A8J6XX15_9BACT|nr:FecR domain-containing protein [Candidatus Polarisedimenticola svalbardensis]
MKDRDKDAIEKLIRLTGPRPAVPDETAQRVKEAVHQHWRESVEDRRRPRRIRAGFAMAAAAAILFTIGLVAWNNLGPLSGNQDPVVVLAVSGSTQWNVGDHLDTGALVTTPEDGGLAIGTGPLQSVRLDSGTTVRLLTPDTLALDQGAVYVDSRGSGGDEAPDLTIRTSLGDFREIGTQFEIRLSEDTVRARVREGRIAVQHNENELEVVAGHEMEINYRGEVRRGEIDPASHEWGWIGELTPMMEIEGRPVLEFLEWIVRERGLQLQFEDPALYSSAGETDISGSIDGMSLDQALEAVLPTCGMTYRIHNGTLTVLRAND